MVFVFQNEESRRSSCYQRRQNPPLVAPLTTHKTYYLKDEALYLTSVLRAGLEESASNTDGRGLLSRALAKGELNQFLVDFFSDPLNLLFARGKVEERRRKMAYLSAMELAVPETHAGTLSRHQPEDPIVGKVVSSNEQPDHSRFDQTASAGRALSAPKKDWQGLHSSDGESVRSCVSLGTLNSESTLGTTPEASFAPRHGENKGVITEDGRHLRKRGAGGRGKPVVDRVEGLRSGVESIHFEGHLLRRACGVTGKLPARSDEGPKGNQSHCSLLEDSGEDQLRKLRRNPAIMDILVRLKALSVSLVHPHGSLGAGAVLDSSTRSKKVGGRLLVRPGRVDIMSLAQKGYVELFEEMLSEILRMQRTKTKVLRAENGALRRELERAREREIKTRAEAAACAVQLEALFASKKALETQVAAQKIQLKALSEEIETHAREDRMARQQDHVGAAKKRKALIEALKEEEHTLRRRFNDMEVAAERAEAGARSVRHLKSKMEKTANIGHRIKMVEQTRQVWAHRYGRKGAIKESVAEAFTQTVADDDGLWDIQDGCTKQVSRNVLQRLRWQAVRRFASCPSCHGMGAHTKVKLYKGKWKLVKDRFEGDPTLLHRRLRREKNKSIMAIDRCWAMPNQLVEFMSHLPKTAQALPIKSLRWLIREIWVILDERDRADAIDACEGRRVQDMNDFVVELFLRRHRRRQDAELQLYTLLVSLKAHFRKNTGAHTFARLMDLLENADDCVGTSSGASAIGARDHESSKGKPSKERDRKESPRREEVMLEQSVTPHNSHLGTAFLPVVLFTRRALLKRPPVDLDLIRREKELKRFEGGAAPATSLVDPPPSTSLPSDEALYAEEQRPASDQSNVAHSEAREHGGLLLSSGSSGRGGGRGFVVGVTKVDFDAARTAVSKRRLYDIAKIVGKSKSHRGNKPAASRKVTVDQLQDLEEQKNSTDQLQDPKEKLQDSKEQLQDSKEKLQDSEEPLQDFKDQLQDSKVQLQHSNDQLENPKDKLRNSHGQGKDVGEDPREGEVPLVDLPPHVYTQDYCTFWVTLETAVRVVTIVLHWCPPMKRHAYMRVLEKNAALLSSKGNITEAQACHSFIRSAMRKTTASVEFELDYGKSGAGSPGYVGGVIQGRGSPGNEEAGGGGVTEHDTPGDARVVIEIDRVVQLVVEVLMQRQSSIEQSLRRLFAEGDENRDGVLTFDEFNKIVTRAAPHFSERRVLRMFREALTTGSEDSFAIKKETFCQVCRQHGLVQLIDIWNLEKIAGRARRCLYIAQPSPPPSAAPFLPPTVTPPTVTLPPVEDLRDGRGQWERRIISDSISHPFLL